MSAYQLEVRGSIWVETPAGLKMGKGRALLLQKIEETGSIAEAARLMEMSYRRAWAMVQALNAAAALPLVEKQSGGKGGGGARLTAEGKKLLSHFWQAFEQFQAFKQQSSQNLLL